MEFSLFRRQFEAIVKARPKLFVPSGADPPATECELQEAERRLGCRLGDKYKAFLAEYGGGEIGTEVLYSVYSGSDWNIVDMNATASLRPVGILAFSENGCGDFYVFAVEGGVAQDKVLFYDHETNTLEDTGHEDFLDYLLAQFTRLP